MSKKRKPNPELAAEKERIEKILSPLTLTDRQRLLKIRVKYVRGVATKGEIEELATAGVIGAGKAENSALTNYDSQSALADAMYRHYNGRINIEISQRVISHWKIGRGLPAGVPLPPPCVGITKRYPGPAWIAWFDTHMLTRYGANGHAHTNGDKPSRYEEAELADAERKIIARDRELREAQIDAGDLIPVSQHMRDLQTVGQVLNAALTEHAEKRLTAAVLEAAKVLAVDEGRMNDFTVALRAAVEQAADGLRQTLAETLTKHEKPA